MKDRVILSFHRDGLVAAQAAKGHGASTSLNVGLVPPKSMILGIDRAALGLVDREVPAIDMLFQVQAWGGLRYNQWEFLANLGKCALIQRRQTKEARIILTPTPEQLFQELEVYRLHNLRTLRMSFDEAADLIRKFSLHAPLSDNQFSELSRIRSANIYFADMLRLYLGRRYGLMPTPSTGWCRGVKVEMELLSIALNPHHDQAVFTRQLIQKFSVDLPEELDAGGFCTQSPKGEAEGTSGASRDVRQTGDERESGPVRRPERLLFYLSLPEFLEFRYLHKANKYEYCVALFTDGRAIMDTALNDNRLFALKGSTAECLDVAAEVSKSTIRQSSICQFGVVHDPSGNWKDKVRNWLLSNT